tara:strand:+ start:437 stop:1099 length:663 start_codon:yes stop_codon:yes gene_type:complete
MTNLSELLGGGGGLQSVQVFTSSGTWTKPDGITKIIVRGVGAGGSGTGKPASTSLVAPGGGAGGNFQKFIDVSAVGSVSVTIGSGGAGVTGGDGAAGGSTSFGAYCTGNGGSGGSTSSVGQLAPVAGGTATGGDINVQGQSGCSGAKADSSYSNTGLGGSSFFGFGGQSRSRGVNSTGEDAKGYGAGGAGASGSQYGGGGGTTYAGGSGTNGIIIVEEYA